MLSCDGCGGGEIQQVLSVFEDPQLKRIRDHLEGFQLEQGRQFSYLRVICQEYSPARVSRIEQVSRGELGRPWGWPGWASRRRRLGVRGRFGIWGELITTHDSITRSTATRPRKSGWRSAGLRPDNLKRRTLALEEWSFLPCRQLAGSLRLDPSPGSPVRSPTRTQKAHPGRPSCRIWYRLQAIRYNAQSRCPRFSVMGLCPR
jgi:hypothetical protein